MAEIFLLKEMVNNAIKAHDFKTKMKEGSSGKGLFVRGRPYTKGSKKES